MLTALIGPVTGLLERVIPDKTEANRLAHEITTLAEKQAHEVAKAQIEVNKVEASHQNLFVAGWRPASGWCCVFGMMGNFIVIPFTNFVMELIEKDIVVPLIPLDTMMPVLLGMLGLGGLRTYEKTKK
jgi:hypothetical protein